MKILVKTTGPFALYDMNQSPIEHVSKERAHIVTSTHFIQQRVGAGHLQVLADSFPDTANDEDWSKTLAASDRDMELAIAAYKSELTPQPVEPKAETKAEKKAREKAEAVAAEEARLAQAKIDAEEKAKLEAVEAEAKLKAAADEGEKSGA